MHINEIWKHDKISWDKVKQNSQLFSKQKRWVTSRSVNLVRWHSYNYLHKNNRSQDQSNNKKSICNTSVPQKSLMITDQALN